MFLQAFLQTSLVLIIFSASDEAKEHVGAAASEASTRLTHTLMTKVCVAVYSFLLISV